MNSMFHSDFFGQRSLGSYAPPAHLGQSDITGVTGDIEDLLKQLPPDILGTYNAKYQACLAQLSGNVISAAMGTKCLYDLYKELKDLVKNGPPKPPVPIVAPSQFPYLPVAIGVLGLGALVYGLTKL